MVNIVGHAFVNGQTPQSYTPVFGYQVSTQQVFFEMDPLVILPCEDDFLDRGEWRGAVPSGPLRDL